MSNVMRSRTEVMVVVSVLVLGAPAAASPAASTTSPEPFDSAPGWAYLDADADGAISPRELDDGQQAARLLLALSWEGCDADGDGKLSLAEYHASAFQAAQALPTSDDDDAQQAESLAAVVTGERTANDFIQEKFQQELGPHWSAGRFNGLLRTLKGEQKVETFLIEE
ncbi:MAG: hypothetical protein GY842_12320, partial [bacterium]|nr:hypothetical protein [bacterium]